MKRELSKIKRIIVHCSDSSFGDVGLIDEWHRQRGWNGCGYHFVITNGVLNHGKPYNKELDGLIQRGRGLSQVGAHCKGQNYDSVGVCLIGRHHFSAKQLYHALPTVVMTLGELGLTWEDVYCHCEFNSLKSCPNIDPTLLRPALFLRTKQRK